MIPVEVGQLFIRRQLFDLSLNQESLAVELELIKELRDKRKIHETALFPRPAALVVEEVLTRRFHPTMCKL